MKDVSIQPIEPDKTEARRMALILSLLKYKNGLPFSKIRNIMHEFYSNENFESDKKKFLRDIEELQSLGYPVKKQSFVLNPVLEDDSTHYKLDEKLSTKKIVFSEKELKELSFLIFKYYESDFSLALYTASQKIFSSRLEYFPPIKDSEENHLKRIKQQEHIISIAKSLIKAIHNKNPVKIQYYKSDPSQFQTRIIEPYKIIKRNSFDFYLLAFDREKKQKRKFLIPKILKLSILNETFIKNPSIYDEDLLYHPLSFNNHDLVELSLECDPERLWVMKQFIYPYPYQVKDNIIIIHTKNYYSLFVLLWREPDIVWKASPERFILDFTEYLKEFGNLYE